MVAFGEWSFGEWSPPEIGRSEIGRSENGRSENGRCTVSATKDSGNVIFAPCRSSKQPITNKSNELQTVLIFYIEYCS
jgi:hypothetical protein